MSAGGREGGAREPIARGVVVALERTSELDALSKETVSILRAVDVAAQPADAPRADADFVALLLHAGSPFATLRLPDLKDRAATAIAVGEDTAACRVALTAVRKQLRAAGATLGPHELVLSPKDFGYLGLESDGLREKLEILLRTLAVDAERLRLRREGWEEPLE